MIDLLWKLFNKTGDIKYYNLLQEIKSEEVNETSYKDYIDYSSSNNSSNGNNNQK